MVSNTTTRGSRRALMSSHHHLLLLSGVASLMPAVTNAFIATNQHHSNNHHQLTTSIHRRTVYLPKRNSFQLSSSSSSSSDEEQSTNSVTGPIYEMTNDDNNNNIPPPKIKLFTKEGCTLCDKVKDILSEIRTDYPHSLYAVDITDDDKQVWFDKYKYDIPVLHMEDVYWTKHRLTKEEAIQGIEEAVGAGGEFEERKGEPDAGRLEH